MIYSRHNRFNHYHGETICADSKHCFVEDKCHTWVAVGVGAVAAGTAAYGAVSSSNSAKSAADANAHNIKNTNQLNYQMFRQSRGADGNAVLPLYMQMQNGQPFEGQLAKDLMGVYSSSQVPFANYKAAVSRMAPLESGAENTAAGIFNGGVQKQMQENFAPVAAGRVAFTRQSAMDALNKTLGQIDAAQASRGFTGDSLSTQMLRFGAQKQMGDSLAGVNIQNLNDTRNIADQALQLRLSNLSLPGTMAGQATNMLSMPTTAYAGNVGASLVPLNFLRIGTTPPFVNQNMPVVQPQVGMGQIIGQAGAGVGGSAFQYLLQQQQQQNYLNQLKTLMANNNNNNAPSGGAPVMPSPNAYDPNAAPLSADDESAMAMDYYGGGGNASYGNAG